MKEGNLLGRLYNIYGITFSPNVPFGLLPNTTVYIVIKLVVLKIITIFFFNLFLFCEAGNDVICVISHA